MQHRRNRKSLTGSMLSLTHQPSPIFKAKWEHRPVVSSPLSSSPIRASSPTSTEDEHISSTRQTQSSPIRPPKFKYATRPTRPNPLVSRRDEVREQRRANFLRSVRGRAEDKAWERRDIEGQFLRSCWIHHINRLSHDAPEISEMDLEDASNSQLESIKDDTEAYGMEEDDTIMDEYIIDDDAELEAMFSSYQQQTQPQPQSPALLPISPSLSDDEYDQIFEELLSAKDVDQVTQMQDQQISADQMDIE